MKDEQRLRCADCQRRFEPIIVDELWVDEDYEDTQYSDWGLHPKYVGGALEEDVVVIDITQETISVYINGIRVFYKTGLNIVGMGYEDLRELLIKDLIIIPE